jgi:riboflavin kinase / FMN adenylyltransferase
VVNLSQNGCSVWVASSTEGLLTPTAVALGKFDGVHLGHQRVIQPILPPTRGEGENVRKHSPQHPTTSAEKEHTYSTVVTFHPHPQEFFSGKPRTLLTPLDEKAAQLRSLAIEQLVLLPFDKELSALSPEEFVEKILVQQLQCQQISVGQDFCFGKQRAGTAQALQLLAAKYQIPVTIVPLQTCNNQSTPPPDDSCASITPSSQPIISTSLIRHTLETGDVKSANLLLGRPYTLYGSVVAGKKLGRTIGFPTANLQLPKDKFLPRQGVYAVRVLMSDAATTCLGVMNIGNRPTVNGTETCVEVHLFDWQGDLYGQELAVQLVQFLRPEEKFPDLEALKTQIQMDCAIAKNMLSDEC